MKKLRWIKRPFMKPFLGVLFLFVFVLVAKADIFEKVSLAIESGNAKEVSRFLGKEVELTINEEEKVYPRTKAEIQLKNFFTKNSPQNFNIIHQGSSSEGAKYAIGNLKTTNGSYRTYFLIKQEENDSFIKELRFEKE